MESTSRLSPYAPEFYPSRLNPHAAAVYGLPQPPLLQHLPAVGTTVVPKYHSRRRQQPEMYENHPRHDNPSTELNAVTASISPALSSSASGHKTELVRGLLSEVPAGPRRTRFRRGGGRRGEAVGRGRDGGGGGGSSRRVEEAIAGDGNGHGGRGFGCRKWKNSGVYQEIIPLNPKEKATSVMIRNIPSNYTKLLVEFLEKHCQHENEKDENKNAVRSAFDFVYLPIDFKHRLNGGFAFVNFTSPEAAWRFHEAVQGKHWDLFQSRKIADITRARIQGKEALVSNFERMKLCAPSSEYLPVWFDPPRDGFSSGSSSSSSKLEMHTIGNVNGPFWARKSPLSSLQR